MPYLSVVWTRSGEVSDAALGSDDHAVFAVFIESHGERLRRVLVAAYGVDIGNDVCADALAYAWEHWDRVGALENPVGYLYRVAQSASRRHRRWRHRPQFPVERVHEADAVEPGLGSALARLTRNQRACVVLVHVYDWTYQQAADALGIPLSSVRNHVRRGLIALRATLESEHGN